jgi:hypothetical protein
MPDCFSNEFIAFYFYDERQSEGQLARAAEEVEQHTPYRVCDLWLSPRGRVGILNLCTVPPETGERSLWVRLKHDWLARRPETNRLRVREELAILQTGYSTTPERRFERSLREEGERLHGADAGGMAAFCMARFGGPADERLFAWSTRPGLRPIAKSEGQDGLVLGTRPRLVHALTRDFRAPSFDYDYMRASLCSWSLDDRTPYQGTTLLPVDKTWRVQAGVCTVQEHPTPPFAARENRSMRRQRGLYRAALHEAVEPLRSLPGFELRLSGGKDSRLMAAVIAERGIVPSTVVCHGAEDSPDVRVARTVAERLGWSLKTAIPVTGYRGGILPAARHNLALSDGFFATEPRHIPYPVESLVGERGPGMVMGHMELQKGGWAHSPRETREHSLAVAREKVARLQGAVVPELCEAMWRRVEEYAATLQPQIEAEYGYLLNYHFRVGRWLTSHCLSHAKEHLLVYPLIDEKVTRVLSGAPLWHLTSERLLAETTWVSAPMLRDLPLAAEPYRFILHREHAARERERAQRKAAQSSAPAAVTAPNAATPSPPPPVQVAPPSANQISAGVERWLDKRGSAFIGSDRLPEICAHVRNGKARDELRAVSQPQFWAFIEQPTLERLRATGMRATLVNEFLFKCCQASILYTDGLDEW